MRATATVTAPPSRVVIHVMAQERRLPSFSQKALFAREESWERENCPLMGSSPITMIAINLGHDHRLLWSRKGGPSWANEALDSGEVRILRIHGSEAITNVSLEIRTSRVLPQPSAWFTTIQGDGRADLGFWTLRQIPVGCRVHCFSSYILLD